MRYAKKQRLLTFLSGYIASNHEAPTFREIGEYFGFTSSGTIFYMLRTLENEGLIERSRKHRGIKVIKTNVIQAQDVTASAGEI